MGSNEKWAAKHQPPKWVPREGTFQAPWPQLAWPPSWNWGSFWSFAWVSPLLELSVARIWLDSLYLWGPRPRPGLALVKDYV